MKNFIYDINTKVYFGQNQLDFLCSELKRFGKNVLLTYGKGSIKKIGLYDKVINLLKEDGFNIFELADIDPNPRITSVSKGAKICKENNINVVLAVGGGSVIDCSKFICANALDDVSDPWDYFSGKAKVTAALPLVTIPTMAATGSEMNITGVLTNEELIIKKSASSPLCRPAVSFLDPTNTYSVSKFQTASGTADIFSHILELYFNFNADFYMLRRIKDALMKTVIKYGPIALNNPRDYEARANLMWASSWAINGFLKAGDAIVWSCHPIEHELSAFYDIAHGLGLAIITPKWMKYCLNEKTLPYFVELGTGVFDIDKNLEPMDIANKCIKKVEDFFYVDLGLDDTLSKVGIKEEDFPLLAKKACKGGTLNTFLPLDQKAIEEILMMSK